MPAFAVEAVNHHPLPIRQPMTLGAETVLLDVGANETKTLRGTAPSAVLAAAGGPGWSKEAPTGSGNGGYFAVAVK